MAAKHLVVDGSNIATEGRSLPSLAQLDEAVRAFLAQRPHEIWTVIVDATFEHRIDASERKLYDEALSNNELIVTPAGTIGRGDRFILEVADKAGATVLSNDSFQEFHGEYKWLFDTGRLVGGRPVPGVGWVFVDRTPVRGPRSRQATRAARGRGASKAASEPLPTPKAPPPGRKKKAAPTTSKAPATKAPAPQAPPREPKRRAERADRAERVDRRPQQPLNDQLPFIEFIAEHLPGSTVEGEVVEFSSHGAYVQVGNVRCYVPLKGMGSPPPRSAREVLERGEQRTFVVQAIHAARRGIDLALPGFEEQIEAATVDETAAPEQVRSRGRRRRPAVDAALPVAATATDVAAPAPAVDKAPAEAGAELPQSEATLAATKKAAGRKTAARKSTARKATARKTSARKATAKRPAKKTTARKATARKTTARKSAAKKSTAKKSTARKSTARKSTAKKAGAKKATARKTAARKTTAKKAGAKKATRKKSTAKKAPAKKKATARKSTAKKSTARKSTAKKAGARKSTAKKAGARKAPARKAAKRR